MAERIEDLFDEYLDAVLAQGMADVDRFLAGHPDLDSEGQRRLRVLASTLQPPRPGGEASSAGAGEERTPGSTRDPGAPEAASAGRDAAPPAVSTDFPRPFGPYLLLGVLGRGGQGVVYLAQDTRLSRRVALKVLDRPDLAAFDDSSPNGPAARLRREAEIASKLDHPGICVVHEMGVLGRAPYVAMRCIEGETLAQRIAVAREAGERMLPPVDRTGSDSAGSAADGRRQHPDRSSAEESIGDRRRSHVLVCVGLIESAARALHAAHESGVVHRDIKPANIMVTPEGKPVLLDFGLARDQSGAAPALTQSGQIFGSPGYMSPEQISRKPSAIDRRTDVYSLGVVLYECLTLRRPFEDPTRDGLFRAILSENPPDPRRLNAGIDRELAVVLETALEKDRDRRYPTAFELAEDLRRWRQYEPILARPASPVLRVKRWTQRNRVLSASLSGILALLVGLLVAAKLVIRRQDADAAKQQGTLLMVGSSAVLRTDPALALLLAIEGARSTRGPTTNDALYAALSRIRELRTMRIDSGPITRVVLAADGKHVITSSRNGVVHVLDVDGGTVVARLHGPARQVDTLQLSADGDWLAGVSTPDLAIFLWRTADWDGRTGVEVPEADFKFSLPDEAAHAPCLSPDLDRVLTFVPHGVCVRSLRDGTVPARKFTGGEAYSASWDRTGERVVLLGPDRIWNPTTGETVPLLGQVGADGRTSRVDFSPDGRLLVTPFGPGGAVVWNTADGSLAARLAEQSEATIAAFNPDGSKVFTGSSDGKGWLFNGPTWRLLGVCLGHTQAISQIQFSRDGARITTISSDGSARVWDASTGDEIAILTCSSAVSSCCELEGGTRMLTGHQDGSVRVWDLADGWTRGILEAKLPNGYSSCCFDPSGARVALSAGDEVRIYDARSHQFLGKLSGDGARVHCVVFTPDGRGILTSSEDGTVRSWDATTLTATGVFGREEHGHPVWSVDVSPDGKFAVTASEDPRVRLFDLSSGQLVREFLHDEGCGLQCAHFSPDGRLVVSTSQRDRSVRVWDLRSGNLRSSIRLESEACRPRFARFSPDSGRVVAGLWDGTLGVWDATDGHAVWRRRVHEGLVNDAGFSPDGSWIVSGSVDETVQVVDAATGDEVSKLEGHKGHVACATFSPKGDEILSVASDHVAHLWPADPAAEASRRRPRELTAEEKARYGLRSDAGR
jgi:WD40 repeat protein/serine/threonine protein kinase